MRSQEDKENKDDKALGLEKVQENKYKIVHSHKHLHWKDP